MRKHLPCLLLVAMLVVNPHWAPLSACSRATWLGQDGSVITGRSMDWPYDFNTHFYVVPRAMRIEGIRGGLTWESRHGAVVAHGAMTPGGAIDGAFDGLNERGLGANLLYLAEADFGPAPTTAKPRISMGAWVTYVLTNFATVKEVVQAFQADPLYIVPSTFGPGGAGHPTVHLSVTDASGDSAIIEYLAGKPVIHHNRANQVMTNSPVFEQQQALNRYWERMDGAKTLPGSHQSEDRFVRVSYYLKRMGTSETDPRKQIAGVMSVMRNVSVPWGAPDPQHPNIAPTYWRTVLDHGRRVYYFDSALSPYVVAVDLKKIDFAAGKGLRRVGLEGESAYQQAGDITDKFQPAEPVQYIAP
ncbi:MAG: linear amide C-N hydrolase [Planctomycetaceae bacterium]